MFRKLLRYLNMYLGDSLCQILRYSKPLLIRKERPKQINRILVIKMAGIGDSVLMLASLYKIKKYIRSAEIDILSSHLNRQVFISDQHFDQVLPYDFIKFPKGLIDLLKYFFFVRKKRYDCVIDMEHYFPLSAILSLLSGAPLSTGFYNGQQKRRFLYSLPFQFNPKQHLLDNYDQLVCNILNTPSGSIQRIPPMFNKEAKETMIQKLSSAGITATDFIICLNPGGSGMREVNALRLWPIYRLIEVIKWLKANYPAKLLLTGSLNEAELGEQICQEIDGLTNLIGKLSLAEYFALLERIDLYIGNDSGPSHIVYANNKPAVIFYGPETPDLYGPKYAKNSKALYHSVGCNPCIKIYLGKRIEKNRCRSPKCMESITVDEVELLLSDLLERSRAPRIKK